jgi:hypothetical protein
MNNALTSKKQINVFLIFDLFILAFFGRGELLVCHSELYHLVSGSYSKIQVSSPVMTCLKNFVIFDAFKKVQAHIPSGFLLLIGETFWNQLCTNFLHAQFEGQNFVDVSAIQIQHYRLFCQTSIRPHEIPHFDHIFIRFLRARSSRRRFVFHTLTVIQE